MGNPVSSRVKGEMLSNPASIMSLKELVQGKLGFLCRKSTTIEITGRHEYRDLGGEAKGINSPVLMPSLTQWCLPFTDSNQKT